MPRITGKIEIHKDDWKKLEGRKLPNPSFLWVAFLYQADERAEPMILGGPLKLPIHSQLTCGNSVTYDFGNVELPPFAGLGKHYQCKILVLLGHVDGEPPDGPVVHKGDFGLEDKFVIDVRKKDKDIKLDKKVLRLRATCSSRQCARCGR